MKTDLKKHLLGVYKVLNSRINLINGSIGHTTTQGTENEEEIKKLLVDFLPQNYGISDGVIIGVDGAKSKQIDIIIFDKNSPNYSLSKDSKIFLADYVIAAIEIKTRFGKKSLNEAMENVATVRSLKLSSKSWVEPVIGDDGCYRLKSFTSTPPLTIVFFYDKSPIKRSLNLEGFERTLRKSINEFALDERPDLLFSLAHSTIFKFKDLSSRESNETYSVILVSLSEDEGKVIDIGGADASKLYKFKLVADFRDESQFIGGDMRFVSVRNKLVIEGGAEEPVMYEIAKYKGKYYLLDKFRSFLNFVWVIEKMVSLKRINKNCDVRDYFGDSITLASSFDELV